jgi:DNA invertase Pin-like site-specific DNA recombinase
MIDFFSNRIVQGVLATFVVVLVLGLFGWLKFRRDEKIVIEFLKKSGVETGEASGTTDAISSATELSRTRIHRICRKSTIIKKHGKQKGSWTLP